MRFGERGHTTRLLASSSGKPKCIIAYAQMNNVIIKQHATNTKFLQKEGMPGWMDTNLSKSLPAQSELCSTKSLGGWPEKLVFFLWTFGLLVIFLGLQPCYNPLLIIINIIIYLEIGQNVFIPYEIADIQDGMSSFFGCLALLACSCDHKYGYGLHDKIMFIIKKKVLI